MAEVYLLRDPDFWSITSWIQLGYGIWVNLTVISIGLAFGFSTIALPKLGHPENPIYVSVEDESWIASALNLSSPLGCIICGYLIDCLGRRFTMVLCHFPTLIGWIYTARAQSSNEIIIGRIITGVGCGMTMSPPRVYLTEISLPNMRGVVGAFPSLAMAMGLTIQASLGSCLSWKVNCYICATYTSFLIICNFFLPESPYYVLMKDSIERTKRTLGKFRSSEYNLDLEMEDLIDYKNDNSIRRLPLLEIFKALLRSSACIPFWIIIIYIIFTHLSGTSVIVTWTIDMLKESNSIVNPHLGHVLLGMTRFVSGILVCVLIFKISRRTLSIISAFGAGVSFIVLGLYLQYKGTTSIVPQICYMSYIAFSTLGHYTLPLLIMNELYPLQIRGILGGVTISLTNLVIFLTCKYYPTVRALVGFAKILIIFGVFSLLCCIYLYFRLPETKDLTLQEIEEYYNNRRPTLVSQRHVMSIQLTKLLRKPTAIKSISKEQSNSGDTSRETVKDYTDPRGASTTDKSLRSIRNERR